MLTKEDLEQITTIVQINTKIAITDAFHDFYEIFLNLLLQEMNNNIRSYIEI